MHCTLTASELDLLTSTVALLSRGESSCSPREATAKAIFTLTGAERMASYRLDPATGRYHEPLLINLQTTHAADYMKTLQDNDPITPRMRRYSKAMRIADVLPLKDFEKTDFYNDFLRPEDMYHGVNVFLRSGRRELCDFRIFRGRSSSPFAERDLMLIDTLAVYLTQALDRPVGSELDLLTAREREIAELVARGCTDGDIARVLGISFSTVRTHVNRCFEKLSCANRSELAAFVTQRRRH